MAENCPTWQGGKCVPPNGSVSNCSYAKRDYDNCAVYKMVGVQARGGSMEDQLRPAGATVWNDSQCGSLEHLRAEQSACKSMPSVDNKVLVTASRKKVAKWAAASLAFVCGSVLMFLLPLLGMPTEPLPEWLVVIVGGGLGIPFFGLAAVLFICWFVFPPTLVFDSAGILYETWPLSTRWVTWDNIARVVGYPANVEITCKNADSTWLRPPRLLDRHLKIVVPELLLPISTAEIARQICVHGARSLSLNDQVALLVNARGSSREGISDGIIGGSPTSPQRTKGDSRIHLDFQSIIGSRMRAVEYLDGCTAVTLDSLRQAHHVAELPFNEKQMGDLWCLCINAPAGTGFSLREGLRSLLRTRLMMYVDACASQTGSLEATVRDWIHQKSDQFFEQEMSLASVVYDVALERSGNKGATVAGLAANKMDLADMTLATSKLIWKPVSHIIERRIQMMEDRILSNAGVIPPDAGVIGGRGRNLRDDENLRKADV